MTFKCDMHGAPVHFKSTLISSAFVLWSSNTNNKRVLSGCAALIQAVMFLSAINRAACVMFPTLNLRLSVCEQQFMCRCALSAHLTTPTSDVRLGQSQLCCCRWAGHGSLGSSDLSMFVKIEGFHLILSSLLPKNKLCGWNRPYCFWQIWITLK